MTRSDASAYSALGMTQTVTDRGEVRSAGQVATRVESLELFAGSLAATDVVALEATTGADKIVSLLQAQGIRVVVANTRKLRSILSRVNSLATAGD